MKFLKAVLVVAPIVVAGCTQTGGYASPDLETAAYAPRTLTATSEQIVIRTSNVSRANGYANQHCAEYGKSAAYEKSDPYKDEQSIVTFRCS